MDRTALPGGVELIFADGRAVAEVRLVRPEVRNAQTMATWTSLTQAAEIIAGRTEVAVVVLSGAGDDFSAGLDLRMMRGTGVAGEGDLGALLHRDDAEVERVIAGFQRAFTCWRQLPTIVVAVITGHAIGAGFQLALAADLRVLRDDAVLVMAEASLGLVPDLGGTRRLVELVGYARALEICATAAPVDADRAERLGLANIVLASDDFETGLEGYLDTLLAIDPLVTRSVKPLLASATTAGLDEQLATERRTQLPLLRRISGSTG
ncbi:MAG TPA: enoyl-CoA hydratase/isomerase family protein [Microlunatus sp.]|nr:enoyl-CoA hydratase/isomerase family protein [Microlunatus sp.]